MWFCISESSSGHYETKTSQLTYTAEVNWKSWLERDFNSHLRDTGLPLLYLLSYRVHRNWPARVNFFSSLRQCRLIVTFSFYAILCLAIVIVVYAFNGFGRRGQTWANHNWKSYSVDCSGLVVYTTRTYTRTVWGFFGSFFPENRMSNLPQADITVVKVIVKRWRNRRLKRPSWGMCGTHPHTDLRTRIYDWCPSCDFLTL